FQHSFDLDNKAMNVVRPIGDLVEKGMDQCNDSLHDIALREHCLWLDFAQESKPAGDDIFRDAIHLNEKGCKLECQAIARVIAANLNRDAPATQPTAP